MKRTVESFAALAAIVLFAAACAPQTPGGSVTPPPEHIEIPVERTVVPEKTAPPTPPSAYAGISAYNDWANSVGYPQGMLVSEMMSGIYPARFRTLPSHNGYSSGKIVIGDSRCCQLGIYQQRSGRSDFAAFAVWGGHYRDDAPHIMSDALLSEVENCFKAQIEANGACSIFFFATVNDYAYASGDNQSNISAAVSAAERFAALEYEYRGSIHRPQVIVIGFDGCRSIGSDMYGIPLDAFNRYVKQYNSALRTAVSESPILSESIAHFTAVPEMTGGATGYIDDGLHYSDETLRIICDHISGFGTQG